MVYNQCILLLLLISSLSSYGKEFTSENGVLNADGQRIYLKGVSWFGFETSLGVFHGLWSVDYNFIFDLLQKNGFNAMRIPFSLDLVLNDPAPKSISYGYCNNNVSCNLDLKGLSSLQVLDRMIQSARDRGIVILLDMHSFEPDAFAANGLWYDAGHPESMVLKGWDILMDRFGNQSNVFAVDVKNEPFLGTWNTGDATTDWDAACKRIGDHVVSKSNWIVFVEGVSKSPVCPDPCFYGGDLKGVKSAPIALSNPKKLVYSPHTYGPNVFLQPYFTDPNFPKNMPAIWDDHFGFIKDQKGPAVVTGEWGGSLTGANGIWINAFVDYLIAKDMTDNFFWCLNPDSGDTGGLLEDDWVTPAPGKFELLARLVPNPTKLSF